MAMVKIPMPTDPGDWVTQAEVAQGLSQTVPSPIRAGTGRRMAGVIAADANNGTGIAGINWNSHLLPVRSWVNAERYESDIADGMRWAAGFPVPGIPANPKSRRCPQREPRRTPARGNPVLLTAVADVVASGTPIVVAAGNSSLSASGYSPQTAPASLPWPRGPRGRQGLIHELSHGRRAFGAGRQGAGGLRRRRYRSPTNGS
jgi:serine protease